MSVFSQIDAREREYKEAMAVVDANRPKHTPGPWTYNSSGRNIRSTSREFPKCQQPVICDIRQWPNGDSMYVDEANACLISAAPDMLSALIILRERHQIDDPHHSNLCEFCKQADYAIAKAKGAA